MWSSCEMAGDLAADFAASLGRTAALLDGAMLSFAHPAAAREHAWDLAACQATVRAYLPEVGAQLSGPEAEAARALVRHFVQLHEAEVAPLLRRRACARPTAPHPTPATASDASEHRVTTNRLGAASSARPTCPVCCLFMMRAARRSAAPAYLLTMLTLLAALHSAAQLCAPGPQRQQRRVRRPGPRVRGHRLRRHEPHRDVQQPRRRPRLRILRTAQAARGPRRGGGAIPSPTRCCHPLPAILSLTC